MYNHLLIVKSKVSRYIRTNCFGLKALLFIALSLTSIGAFAGLENHRASARSFALGGTGLLYTDAYASWNNQAALGWVDKRAMSAYYEMPATLAEIRMVGVAAVMPLKKNSSFGFSAYNYGNQNYSETKVGLGYGMKLSSKVSVGAQIDYFQLAFGDNYGSTWAVTTELGIMAEVSKNLYWGAHIYNPNRANVGGIIDEKSPAVYRTGLSYVFGNQSTFNVEIEKDSRNLARVRSGMEYHITEILYLRGGIATNPFIYSFGFGVKAKNFAIDVASSFHAYLGYTPACSITYHFE